MPKRNVCGEQTVKTFSPCPSLLRCSAVDPEGNEVVSTSGAEAKRCERGLYGGAARVCATKIRYNFWQAACQIDIRGASRAQRNAEISRECCRK